MTSQRPLSPPWSMKPTHQWSIIEVKNGVEVAVHNITEKSKHRNSRIVLFGRAADQVDIEMQHESISRFHARIAFDKEGETPWLRDLSSKHGVFVNKRRLPAVTIGREETMSSTAGSRGIMLYPDDIIQFGASSRLFCVVGPEKFRRKEETHHESTMPLCKENTEITLHNEVVHDSFDPFWKDAVSDNNEFKEFLSDEAIPASLRAEWEKLKLLQLKVENIGNESERIQMKGDISTLSTGQAKQLERNNERIAALKDQIRIKESELYGKIYPNSRSYARRISEKFNDDLDEEDDCYFDRTGAGNENMMEFNEGGETAETLMQKWTDKHKEMDEVASKLMTLSQKETRLRHELNTEGDVFFIENDLSLVHEPKEKLQQTQVILLKNLGDIEQMIHVANPKLKKSKDGLSWEDSTSISEITHAPADVSTVSTQESHKIDFSIKKTEPPVHQSSTIPLSKRQKRSVPGMSGTVALFSNTKDSLHQYSHEEKTRQEKDVRLVCENSENQELLQHDHWQPPKDQDGSGRTKLNAKFDGRY